MQIVPVPPEKLLHVFPFGSHGLGRDLSLVSFFIQVTDTSVCRSGSAVCLLLPSTIKGHREQAGVRRSVAALQLCCRPCSLHLGLLFLKGLRHCLCFLLLSSPCWRPQSPCLLNFTFSFALTPWTCCKITWVLQVSYLSVFVPNLVGEREWGREVSEWLAIPSNRKITKTSSSTVKFSVRGRAPHSQMWLQGQMGGRGVLWVPLTLERACVLAQKIRESFLCNLVIFFYR